MIFGVPLSLQVSNAVPQGDGSAAAAGAVILPGTPVVAPGTTTLIANQTPKRIRLWQVGLLLVSTAGVATAQIFESFGGSWSVAYTSLPAAGAIFVTGLGMGVVLPAGALVNITVVGAGALAYPTILWDTV